MWLRLSVNGIQAEDNLLTINTRSHVVQDGLKLAKLIVKDNFELIFLLPPPK